MREPVYDGFTRTGEVCRCTGCGAEFPPDQLEAAPKEAKPDVFGDVEIEKVTIEGQGEAPVMCRHCTQYVVNAFTQRCSRTFEEVEATHSCEHFERAEGEV